MKPIMLMNIILLCEVFVDIFKDLSVDDRMFDVKKRNEKQYTFDKCTYFVFNLFLIFLSKLSIIIIIIISLRKLYNSTIININIKEKIFINNKSF